ncbi:MAG TPA: peptidoglycan DD-metalloendopeptidase family protein [bacterium]|nr:peptidoglycan DD-metalloendopeptidase family protein [bacterium]
MKTILKIFLPMALLAPAVLSAQEAAPTPSYRQIKKNLRQHKKDLDAIRKKIDEEKRKKHIDEVREKRTLGRLEQVDRALGRLKREKEVNQADLQETRTRLSALLDRKALNEKDLAASRALLKKRLRDLNRMSFRKPFLGGLLDSENFSELSRKLRFELMLAQSNEKILNATLSQKDRLDRSTALWDSEQRRKERVLGALGRQEKNYSREKKNRTRILASIQKKKEDHERYIEELNQAARELQEKVSVFLKQAEEAQKQKAAWVPAGKGLASGRGRLAWPVSGQVIQHFGHRKNVQFKEVVDNSGIQIQADAGTPIKAIAGGKVRFADWFKGYGKLVILDHGEGYYSIYAQASELAVAEGQTVASGQVIGAVGDTGSLVGNSLYFEIRKNGIPQDPLLWLKPR